MVDGAREIDVVYLVMKFQGEMEVEGLTPERREELKREAMERYKADFEMENTCVLSLSADEVCRLLMYIAQASNR
jgi:hypothetical protein